MISIKELLHVSLDWAATPVLELRLKNSIVHSDLPLRSYSADGPGVAHYTSYQGNLLHAGLGEKSSPFDLSGRTFRLAKSDALYKHIPLLYTGGPAGIVAQFSTSHSRGSMSVGDEIDGLWSRYKVLRQDYGGLEEYILSGRRFQMLYRAMPIWLASRVLFLDGHLDTLSAV
jgi:hypothetical protein